MHRITPTGHGATAWNGIYEGRSALSTQQIAALERLRIDRHTVSLAKVQLRRPRERNAQERGWGIPADKCFESVEARCPILRKEKKRFLVITPGGDQRWFPR